MTALLGGLDPYNCCLKDGLGLPPLAWVMGRKGLRRASEGPVGPWPVHFAPLLPNLSPGTLLVRWRGLTGRCGGRAVPRCVAPGAWSPWEPNAPSSTMRCAASGGAAGPPGPLQATVPKLTPLPLIAPPWLA